MIAASCVSISAPRAFATAFFTAVSEYVAPLLISTSTSLIVSLVAPLKISNFFFALFQNESFPSVSVSLSSTDTTSPLEFTVTFTFAVYSKSSTSALASISTSGP